jgi:hypothetical protein
LTKNKVQRLKNTACTLELGSIAQTVGLQLPNVGACARYLVGYCGFYAGQSGTGAGFLEVLLLSSQTASDSLSRAGRIGKLMVDILNGLILTPNKEIEGAL